MGNAAPRDICAINMQQMAKQHFGGATLAKGGCFCDTYVTFELVIDFVHAQNGSRRHSFTATQRYESIDNAFVFTWLVNPSHVQIAVD